MGSMFFFQNIFMIKRMKLNKWKHDLNMINAIITQLFFEKIWAFFNKGWKWSCTQSIVYNNKNNDDAFDVTCHRTLCAYSGYACNYFRFLFSFHINQMTDDYLAYCKQPFSWCNFFAYLFTCLKYTFKYLHTQFDVVVILYWGDAFLCGNCLPRVDEHYYKAELNYILHFFNNMLLKIIKLQTYST